MVITDSKVLSEKQIEAVIRSDTERVSRRNSFVIIENKSNRDLISLLSLLRITEVIRQNELIPYELKNRLNVKRKRRA